MPPIYGFGRGEGKAWRRIGITVNIRDYRALEGYKLMITGP